MSVDRDNWPWGLLGLDGQVSEREVRRAYARRLKQMNPEVEADAFEALRDAYEFARQITVQFGAEPDGRGGDAGADPEGEQPTAVPEEQLPSAPSLPDAQDEAAQEKTTQKEAFGAALARLQKLIGERNFELGAWETLLDDPALDLPDASFQFERTLLASLRPLFALGSDHVGTHLSIGADWLELIENRYGWKSDGLRLQSRFPASMDLRETYLELREDVGLDAPPPKMQEVGQYLRVLREILWLLVSPPAFAILAAIALFLGFGDATRGPNRSEVGLAMGAVFVVWALAPRRWKNWRLPPRPMRPLGAAGRWLGRRSVLAMGLNAWLAVLVALYLHFVVAPNYRQGWIAEREVPALSEKLALSQSMLRAFHRVEGDLVPSFEGAARAARNLSSGRASETEVLRVLDLPYPLIAVPASPHVASVVVDRRPVPFSYLTLRRGEAVLSITTSVEVHAVATLVPTGQEQVFILSRPRVELAWDKHGKAKGGPSIWPQSFRGQLMMNSVPSYVSSSFVDLAFYTSGADAQRGTVDVNTPLTLASLAFVPSRGGEPPRLRVERVEGAYGGVQVDICKAFMRAAVQRSVITINPRAQGLLSELCTIPPDVLQLDWSGRGGAGEMQTAPLEWQLSDPLEQFMFALAPDAQEAMPNAPEQRALSRRISDQIIRDYLTIFWSTPLPDRLRTYLAAHPELGPPVQAPDSATLRAAVARQPHLVNLYRFRDELGAAVLRDMFDYLSRKHLLAVEA